MSSKKEQKESLVLNDETKNNNNNNLDLELNGKDSKGKAVKPKGVRIHEQIFAEEDDRRSSESEDENENTLEQGIWDEERQKRETWVGRMDFILSCIGYAVGLGNVWRFPYLCYRSGGGAFLVPYFFFLVVCGMPLIMLEMSVGQFCSLSPTALYQKMCPFFQGIGWGMVIVSGLVCIYYNIIITWTLYYLFLSFRAVLPWASCGNWWNSDRCVAGIADLTDNNYNQSLTNNNNQSFISDMMASMVNGTSVFDDNQTEANITEILRRTASEEFWQKYVLRLSPGIHDLGSVRWQLLASLLVAWILIFACLFKGVKSSGRVVYVTATFPYLVMIILCIRGLTLPGALDGVKFYLIPEWHRLKELSVWLDAASQIFYSVGAAWGALITMASYNRFRHNCYRDAIIIPMINCGTSVFAGIVVFSIIGFMAHESGKHVKDVIASGPGLAFIVYPEATTKLPLSPLWAVLFFVMLLTIGVDSQISQPVSKSRRFHTNRL